MADFNKSFNFRGGLQVDNDVFIVRGQQVGIGSSVPTQRLDVNGVVKAKGLIVDSTDGFFIETANVGVLSAKTVRSEEYRGPVGGIATYYGDGSGLTNLPTSSWSQANGGTAYEGIYSTLKVGVDTNDPRYEFQVGGVPFPSTVGPSLGAQDGVGIENGNVFVSGIVSTRGDYIGRGTLITELDAANLTVNSLSSSIYGPLIVTNKVIADEFVGTATSASSLDPNADVTVRNINADGAVFQTLNATDKITSINGYVSIGDEIASGTNGGLEVTRNDTSDAAIYSLSVGGKSSVYVGSQRPGSSRRSYGGIEVNGSQDDLELSNYDVGSLDFFLHRGSGGQGATLGSFRWIYGQTGRILADLDRFGKLSLTGNTTPSTPTLEVTGIASITDSLFVDNNLTALGSASISNHLTVGGDLSVSGISTVEELTVSGNLQIDGTLSMPAQVSIDELTVDTKLVVGDSAGANVLVGIDSITVGNTFIDGSNVNTTNINVTNTGIITSLISDNVRFDTQLRNNNASFTANQDGNVQVNDLTLTGDLSGGVITGTSINGPLSGDVNSSGTSTFSTVGISTANIGTINLTNPLSITDGSIDNFDSTTATISTANINSLANSGTPVILFDDINANGNEITSISSLVSTLIGCGSIDINNINISLSGLTTTSVKLTFSGPSITGTASAVLALTAD